jgi:hypothetical protein
MSYAIKAFYLLGHLKNPMTRTGIEPGTFRLITECLNHLRVFEFSPPRLAPSEREDSSYEKRDLLNNPKIQKDFLSRQWLQPFLLHFSNLRRKFPIQSSTGIFMREIYTHQEPKSEISLFSKPALPSRRISMLLQHRKVLNNRLKMFQQCDREINLDSSSSRLHVASYYSTH